MVSKTLKTIDKISGSAVAVSGAAGGVSLAVYSKALMAPKILGWTLAASKIALPTLLPYGAVGAVALYGIYKLGSGCVRHLARGKAIADQENFTDTQ